jgi:hypothetical protein
MRATVRFFLLAAALLVDLGLSSALYAGEPSLVETGHVFRSENAPTDTWTGRVGRPIQSAVYANGTDSVTLVGMDGGTIDLLLHSSRGLSSDKSAPALSESGVVVSLRLGAEKIVAAGSLVLRLTLTRVDLAHAVAEIRVTDLSPKD